MAPHVALAARARFAYERLRLAISYSRVCISRTPSAVPSSSKPAGLLVGFRARCDCLGLSTFFIFAIPGLHTPRAAATSLQRAHLAMGHSCFQVGQESWTSLVGEPHDCGRSCPSP
jgi:hypothetical protein